MSFFKNLKIGTKIIIGYVVLLVLLVFIVGVLLFNLNTLTNDFNFLVEHDQPVLANAALMQKSLIDQETGLRGYLITGDEEFLEPFNNGIAEFDALIETEKVLVSDNPPQVALLDEIDAGHNDWLEKVSQPELALRQEADKATVSAEYLQELLKGGTGKGIMDELRGVLGEMETDLTARGDLESAILAIKISKDMVDAETGQRGFIITGEESFLEPFNQGEKNVTGHIAALRRRLSNDPANLARLAQAEALATDWREKAGEPEIEARRELNANSTTLADIAALVAEGAGKAKMDIMRGKFDTFTQVENDLNAQRSQAASEQTSLMMALAVGLTVGAIIISLIISIAISRVITVPLSRATTVAVAISKGDLSQQVEVNSRDETGILTRAFGEMIVYLQQMAESAGHLAQGDLTVQITPKSDQDVLGNTFYQMIADWRNLIRQVQQGADQVAGSSQQLNASTDQAGYASQQVTSTIQQIANGAGQQTQAVTETTGTVEQMARAAEGIARGAQEQAAGVQRSADLINEMDNIVDRVGQVADSVSGANGKVTQAARHGVSAVEQTGQGMQTIRTRTLEAAERVQEMGNRSKEIGRIVDTIDDIADKTDMLALNAAVEAARAGEHGRGFAVVADQVRKLSEDSKNATRDIGDLIERVQGTVNEAIAAMEATANEVDNGIRLAGDTTGSLQEILQAAEEAAELSEQIDAAVAQLKQKSASVVTAVDTVSTVVEENTASAEQMAANTLEVTQAMEGVAAVAEENSAATEEVSASAEEMSAQIEEVVASAEELSALAEELQAATAQFRVEESSWVEQEQPKRKPQKAAKVQPGYSQQEVAPVAAGQHNGHKEPETLPPA